MSDTNHIEIDAKNIDRLVSDYIRQNFAPLTEIKTILSPVVGLNSYNIDSFNFFNLFRKKKEETFSKMLFRLIVESGEKNSTIYTRANIDRRHFSKIASHDDYQPSKPTVLAFAIALKLDFDKTKALLASAGFTLTNSNLSDVIVSAFIENKIFDIDLVNQILYKYNQPLLGG